MCIRDSYKVYEVKDKIGKARYVETVKIDIDLPRPSGLKGSTSAPGQQPRLKDTVRAHRRKAADRDEKDEDDGGDGGDERPDQPDKPGDRREDEEGDEREEKDEEKDTEEQPSFLIGLYHTHNDECLIPFASRAFFRAWPTLWLSLIHI